jgi:hypothetical protein
MIIEAIQNQCRRMIWVQVADEVSRSRGRSEGETWPIGFVRGVPNEDRGFGAVLEHLLLDQSEVSVS